jgi:hypothetical protein
MKTALKSEGASHRWSLTVPSLVALTVLAAAAVLASAVNAAFFILAAFAAGGLVFAGLAAVLAVGERSRATTPGAKKYKSPTPAVEAIEDRPSFIVLPAHARADEMRRVLFAHQNYFPVTQGREIVGIVSKGRMLSALAHGQGARLIVELMNSANSARPVLAK